MRCEFQKRYLYICCAAYINATATVFNDILNLTYCLYNMCCLGQIILGLTDMYAKHRNFSTK